MRISGRPPSSACDSSSTRRRRELESAAEAKVEELSALIPQDAEAEDEQEPLSKEAQEAQAEIIRVNTKLEEDLAELETEYETQIDEVEALKVGDLLTETKHRELRAAYPEIFTDGMGAEAVLEILKGMDLDAKKVDLQEIIRTTSGQRRQKAIKTLRVVEAFRKSGNKAEWMVLSVLPVLPPELRPMVQLDGGRFATSDLNDLYRRVINRNNRLKRLIDLQAPEIIIRNEKRMLQEAGRRPD